MGNKTLTTSNRDNPIATSDARGVNERFSVDASVEKVNAPILASERYVLDPQDFLGEGAWGKVYRAFDRLLNCQVAIKVLSPTEVATRQQQYRGLSDLEIMQKEHSLSTCPKNVPHYVELDANKRPFLVMPVYKEGTLQRLLDSFPVRERGLDEKTLDTILEDVAEALGNGHTMNDKVHGDIKPDNILKHRNNWHLNDWGTSTIVEGEHIGPRDRMGHVYTRAIEAWQERYDPHPEADVFSWGCLAYRLISGKYPFEEEINNSKDPAKFFEQTGVEMGNKLVKQKVKNNIPYHLRPLLTKCLNFSPSKRFKNGLELRDAFQEAISYKGLWGELKKMGKIAAMYGLGATALGGLGYAIVSHEPHELEMPKMIAHGELRVGNKITKEEIQFEFEQLPYPKPFGAAITTGEDFSVIYRTTNNRDVAYITSRYMRAAMQTGKLSPNDHQYSVYSTYRMHQAADHTLPVHIQAPAKCIEYAMHHAKNLDGKIDLEDMCVIARLGTITWEMARKAAKSDEYRNYVDAKDRKGNYIIPRDEKLFLEVWRGHLHTQL